MARPSAASRVGTGERTDRNLSCPNMRLHYVIRLSIALTTGSVRALAGQGEHQHAGTPPERLGRVEFKTTCSPAAQRPFERGLALLHSFWYEEAGRAFADGARADPGCAMAHWGRAMSLLHPLWVPPPGADARDGLAEAEQAARLSRAGTRERGYAEAIATFYRGYDGSNFRSRLEA